MPQIQDILESSYGATVFSTLDLKSGYWQMEMEADSIEKSAFITSSGLYEFPCVPFGLKTSASSFQRLMERVLWEVKGKCCMVYIDNVVVCSSNITEHFQHLQKVFWCLPSGLTLNLKSVTSFKAHFQFLQAISATGYWMGRVCCCFCITFVKRRWKVLSEKECLAVVWALEKWRQYLEGREFKVITDHTAWHWHSNTLCRLLVWFVGPSGCKASILL